MTSVHIHQPQGYYLGQIRFAGHRRWETVTGKRNSAENAMALAVLYMTPAHYRARVLFVPDDDYYEPNVVMECKR